MGSSNPEDRLSVPCLKVMHGCKIRRIALRLLLACYVSVTAVDYSIFLLCSRIRPCSCVLDENDEVTGCSQTSTILRLFRNRSMSTYSKEKSVAISAVLKACHVARNVQHRLINEETATKSDKSPVTGLSSLDTLCI